MVKVAKRCNYCNNIRWVDAEGFCTRCTPEVRRQSRERRHSPEPGEEPRWKVTCGNCGRVRKASLDPSTRRRKLICTICRRGVDETGTPDRPVAPEPTNAAPGSEEKKRIMRQRAAAGYAVFHPHDNTHCVSGSKEFKSVIL